MSNLKGITDNRGGARPGAGRKPIYEISEHEVKQLINAAKKKAKETGKSLADVLLDLAYQTKDKRTALGAMRIYFDRVIIKNTEKDITISKTMTSGVFIYSDEEKEAIDKLPPKLRAEFGRMFPILLPETKPDPAKLITEGENKDDELENDE